MTLKKALINIYLLIALILFSPLNSEEKIDIWKNKKNDAENQNKLIQSKLKKKNDLNNKLTVSPSQSIQIENSLNR